MSISYLATIFTVATLALAGCSSDATATPPPTKPFELDGPWIYLGPSDPPHDLKISDGTMDFADVAGAWAASFTIKSYDNDLHHFQLLFSSGTGSYLPVGDSLSGTYDLSGSLLTLQFAKGLASYPPLQGAGTCTSATDGAPLPDCKLYIKKN